MLYDFELLVGLPDQLGLGYSRVIELCSGVWLSLSDWDLHQSWLIKVSAHDHLVQHLVLLSGAIHHEGVYPTSAEHRSYLSNSGISPSYVAHMSDRSG
jgi:hypothetical protein